MHISPQRPSLLALPFVVFIVLFASSSIFTQLIESRNAQSQIDKILEDSGKHFKDGLSALSSGRASESGKEFDRSVETFLSSTINIQRDSKLQACYAQLIETIYRIEFPTDSAPPQLRALSLTCGWKWNDSDHKLADEVLAFLKISSKRSRATIDLKPDSGKDKTDSQRYVGFSSQQFEPSSLDELSRLELTLDEMEIDGVYRNDVNNAGDLVNVKTVKAQAGDTVSKLSVRNGVDPTEVAKYNGLLPNSVLGYGREIKIPIPTFPRVKSRPYARPISGQPTRENTCKVVDFPFIQGTKVGMRQSQVINRYKSRATKGRGIYAGETVVLVRRIVGVQLLSLRFYNSKLFEVTVFYDNSIRWTGITEFARTVSSALKLDNRWEPSSFCTAGSNCRRFSCSDAPFILTLGEANGWYSLNIWDPKVFAEMLNADTNRNLAEQRRMVLEQEKRKREFKP